MERREEERRPRRVQIRYWPQRAEKSFRGYSANISMSGMYIDTSHLVPQGTRIRLEVCSPETGFMIEAVVTRVNKSKQMLRPSGLGVRFLAVDELLGELMPGINAVQEGEEASLPPGTFRLVFADQQQFFAAYERDLSTGGLFIPTDEPAAINEVVTILMSVAEPGVEPISFQARVVHRLEPSMPEGTAGGNLMAGMGVQLSSFETTLKAIWGMVAQLRSGG